MNRLFERSGNSVRAIGAIIAATSKGAEIVTSTQSTRFDRLLAFLPDFEAPTPSGEWDGGERQADGAIIMPWFKQADFLDRFVAACYEGDWVRPQFDWSAWQPEAARYEKDPTLVASADVETLERLLTCHIRADRFVEGHLGAMVESGQITAILRRLRQLRGSVPVRSRLKFCLSSSYWNRLIARNDSMWWGLHWETRPSSSLHTCAKIYLSALEYPSP